MMYGEYPLILGAQGRKIQTKKCKKKFDFLKIWKVLLISAKRCYYEEAYETAGTEDMQRQNRQIV